MKDYAAVEGWVTYVPEFDDNREDLDPITAEIKPLTVREAQRRGGNVTAKNTRDGIRTNAVDIRQQTFCGHVRNICHLRVGGKDITTPEELLDTGLNALVEELDAAITDASRLSEGDLKNCKLRSDGSVGRVAGTAGSAAKSSKG
jgi:hypothetical protein